MNFKRGYQMILHDTRLWSRVINGPPTESEWWWDMPVVPPDAYRVLQVKPEDRAANILSQAAAVANAANNGKGLDALHIMAHGNQSCVQFGKDWLYRNNVNQFAKVANKVRYVVFWSCLVGKTPVGAPLLGTLHPQGGSWFGRCVAEQAQAEAVMARDPQLYHWRKVKDKAVLDFGDWEGPVDIYSQYGMIRSFQTDFEGQPKLDLEKVIFGKN